MKKSQNIKFQDCEKISHNTIIILDLILYIHIYRHHRLRQYPALIACTAIIARTLFTPRSLFAGFYLPIF